MPRKKRLKKHVHRTMKQRLKGGKKPLSDLRKEMNKVEREKVKKLAEKRNEKKQAVKFKTKSEIWVSVKSAPAKKSE